MKLEEIALVQKNPKVFAIRIFYEKPNREKSWGEISVDPWNLSDDDVKDCKDWPVIKLELKMKETDSTKWVSYSNEDEIISNVIDNILEKCENVDVDHGTSKNYPMIIISNCSSIAMSTKRSPGNFAICSPKIVSILQENDRIYKDGILNGTVQILVTDNPKLQDKIIVGYTLKKKPDWEISTDGGYIVAIKDDEYQIVDIDGSENYYRVLKGI